MVRLVRAGRARLPRVWLAACIAFALSLGGLDDVVQYRIDQLMVGHEWSAMDWEARHLPRGLRLILDQARAGVDPAAVDDRLRAYLGDATAPSSTDVPLDLALALAIQRQLVDDGLPTVGPWVAPPVSLSLAEPPLSLVVSPRDEIRLAQFALLEGTTDAPTIEALERDVERLNLSALVVPIGGIATYPTLIPPDTPPAFALQTVAHEWTHTALFFRPLGRAYGSTLEARTINETTADLVGQEVAQGILARLAPRTTGEEDTGARARQPDAFDVRVALREIRQHVDTLLRGGAIDEAELYMEQQRQDLVARGYRIRRLNQAYFAFYGSYAEGPQRSTEIPGSAGAALAAEFRPWGLFWGRSAK